MRPEGVPEAGVPGAGPPEAEVPGVPGAGPPGAGSPGAGPPGQAPLEVRSMLAIALDVGDLGEARRLASAVGPYFGVAKVGLELYSVSGPDAVTCLVEDGFDVFCDLKLHDIPNTVERAARRIGALGARYLTVHGAGGAKMLGAAVAGFGEGRAGRFVGGSADSFSGSFTDAGTASAGGVGGVLAVTVLTSETSARPALLRARARLALETGCAGVVCAAADLPVVGPVVADLVRAVPGIRPAGGGTDDQARTATPSAAIVAGASLLVVGRAVTAARDIERAAAAVAAEVAAAADDRLRGAG